MSTLSNFRIFTQIDERLGQYYKSLNKPYFSDNGAGKFIQFCIDSAQNEDDIVDELSDYEYCGYLDFDEHFPFDSDTNNTINESQKKYKIFQILKQIHNDIINIHHHKKDESHQNLIHFNTAFDENLQILCTQINRILTKKITQQIATITTDEFKSVVYDQEYETIDDIKQDILDVDDSLIIDKITQNPQLSHSKTEIEKWIKHCVDGKMDMNIKNFVWDVRFDKELIQNTIKLLKEECRTIFRHPQAPQNDGTKETDDVNLCIAKSIDIENNYPILLWLTDTFSRYRMEKHKRNTLGNVPFHKDDVAVNYDIAKWFENDNPFTKYLTKEYREMSDIIKIGMASLCRRSLPVFNFNAKLFPTLCDSLSVFAKYTLILHRFCHQLQALAQRNYPFLPVQFDVLIIPQCVYRKPLHNLSLFLDESDDDDDDESDNKEVYHQLGKAKHYGQVQNAFWRLDKYLDIEGYVKGKDYWMSEIDVDEFRPSTLQDIWDKEAKGSLLRHQRYVFIIDRRNPINLQNEKLNLVPFDIDKDTSTSGWKDCVYLIKPKVHHIINKHTQILPEQLLGLSSQFIFPNPEKKEPDPIAMLEALNGYKFGFSFHITSEANGKCYFYYGPGAIRFYLRDIHWLWPRFFVQIGKEYQTLDKEIIDQIESFNQSNKHFKDPQFEQFEKQTYTIQ